MDDYTAEQLENQARCMERDHADATAIAMLRQAAQMMRQRTTAEAAGRVRVPDAGRPLTSGGDFNSEVVSLAALNKSRAKDGEQPKAYLHIVAQDDGTTDQALSFSKDSFPFEGVGGFRSVGCIPLYATFQIIGADYGAHVDSRSGERTSVGKISRDGIVSYKSFKPKRKGAPEPPK